MPTVIMPIIDITSDNTEPVHSLLEMPQELFTHILLLCEPQHLLYGPSRACKKLRNIILHSAGEMQFHMWNADKDITHNRTPDRYLITYDDFGRPPRVDKTGVLPEGVRLLKSDEFPGEPKPTKPSEEKEATEGDEQPDPELSKEPKEEDTH
ncbi:hypothetical protein MBLNU13_g05330t1 [Cladosporium sp. NU13]